jgi:hypothetical protein
MKAEHIRLLLVQTPRFLAALDGSGKWERAESFGQWVLYRPRRLDPAQHLAQSGRSQSP